MHENSPPEPVQRTPFDRWLWERDISNVEAGKRLGRHAVTVGRWRLPFRDPARRIPDQDSLRLILALTDGEITPSDFYPPDLNGLAVDLIAEPIQ